jgi:enoyl-CoA hydratase
MSYEMIDYEKRNQIAHITFNRAEKLNAYNKQMMEELVEIWKEFAADPDLRVAIITGKGKGFCAGFDLKEGAAGVEDISSFAPFTPKKSGVLKPVICAVNGICAGGGFRFLLESDIPICSDNAAFLDPHVSVGYMSQPEMVILSRTTGYFNALRIALMGQYERLPAQRAYDLGIVTEVVPQDQLLARAEELANTIRLNAPGALRSTIEGMWKGLDLGLSEATQLSGKISDLHATTPEYIEGPLAFSEKRKPNWQVG